jgi:hypothetical protein
MSNTTFKLFPDKMGATTATQYIGKKGEIFYDIDGITPIRLSDGVTPGGIPFGIISVNQTYNPQFTDASGTFAIGGGLATASYVLQGLICHFRINVQFSATTTYGTGQYQFNLPFPAVATTSVRGGTLHMTTGTGAPSKFHIAGIVDTDESTTAMKLYYFATTTDLDWKYNTPNSGFWASSGSQNAEFDLSGAYQIAS